MNLKNMTKQDRNLRKVGNIMLSGACLMALKVSCWSPTLPLKVV